MARVKECIILLIITLIFAVITTLFLESSCVVRKKKEAKELMNVLILYEDKYSYMYETFMRNLRKITDLDFDVQIIVAKQIDSGPLNITRLIENGILRSFELRSAKCTIVYDIRNALNIRDNLNVCKRSKQIGIKCSMYNSYVVQYWETARSIYSKELNQCGDTSYIKYKGNVYASQLFSPLNHSAETSIHKNSIYATYVDKWGSNWILVVNSLSISEEHLNKIKWYSSSPWLRASPVVVQKYKLIFFFIPKAACTYWRYLLTYVQRHNIFQKVRKPPEGFDNLPHLPVFSNSEVINMMFDKTWSKATFVREPRERMLSAYLNKAVYTSYVRDICKRNVSSFDEFLELQRSCPDTHWEPQARLPPDFYKGMMVGKMNNITGFTEELLRKIGAWSEHIKEWLNTDDFMSKVQHHSTDSRKQLNKFFTPSLQEKVFTYYSKDYEVFEFSKSYFSSTD